MSLEVCYLRSHGDAPISVATPDDIGSLIDRVRRESPREAPILVNILIAEDPYSQLLDVGVSGERGVVRYSGRDWPDGVVSTNGEPRESEESSYFFQDHSYEFPSNSEIPLDLVRQAVQEFMVTDGERPTCVDWQPDLLAEFQRQAEN